MRAGYPLTHAASSRPAGGRIEKIAPTSTVIPGTITKRRRWTEMELVASGLTIVPGALVPAHVSLEQDCAVFIEPNVSVRYLLPD